MNNKYKSGILILVIGLLGAFILVILLNDKKETKYVPESLINEINQISERDIVWGDINCTHTIFAYLDYNCIYCQKFWEETLPELNKQYIQTGKINVVVRLVCGKTNMKAIKACQTAICINQFGRYESLHELFMHESNIIYTDHFDRLIDEYIASNVDIAECILNQGNSSVLKNIYQLQELNSRGTPTFVIENEIVVGYKGYEYWEEKIETKFNVKNNANEKDT